MTSQWLIGLLQIMGVNIILSGDNALVIALACRGLPGRQRVVGVWLGTMAAVVLRIVLAAAIVFVLSIPLLKLAGAAMLLWIAIRLMVPETGAAHDDDDRAASAATLWMAVKIVVVADAIMSLDNVISVAAAAGDHFDLLAIGIAISIPLVVIGSQLMLWLIDRFAWIIVAGAALLGWIAGQLAATDPWLDAWSDGWVDTLYYVLPPAGAIFVVASGMTLAARVRAAKVGQGSKEG